MQIGTYENQEDFLSTVAYSVAQLWLCYRTCLFSKGLSISCFSYSPSSLPYSLASISSSLTEQCACTLSFEITACSYFAATTNSSQLGPFDGQTVGPTAARSETRPGTSPAGATEESTMEPRTSSAHISTVGSTSSATASSTMTARPLVTSSTSTSTAAIPTSTSTLDQPLEPMHEKASVLDVGDDENPGKCSAFVPALTKHGNGFGLPQIASRLY